MRRVSASTSEHGRTLPVTAWKPGQSGNPNGRPKPEVDIAALARVHGPKCIDVVARMLSDKDGKLRLAAATALLDRGFGRPNQSVDVNTTSVLELHLVAARAISDSIIAAAGDGPPTIDHETNADPNAPPTE